MLLCARWRAFRHQLRWMLAGDHRILRVERKPAGAWFFRTEHIFCKCGKQFD